MLLTAPNSLHFHSLLCFPFSFTWSIFDSEDYTWDYLEQKYQVKKNISSSQFSSVAQSCLTHCDPVDCSTSGLPVHDQLLEFTQIHSLSWWCHPTISYSFVAFSSCPQSFPASGSFQMSWFFALGGQSIGVSASTSVLPMNIQDWSPLG